MCGDHWNILQASTLPSHLVCGSQSHNLLGCVAGKALTGPSHWQDRENKYKAIRGTFPCPERAMASDLAIFFPSVRLNKKLSLGRKSTVESAQLNACVSMQASHPSITSWLHHPIFTAPSRPRWSLYSSSCFSGSSFVLQPNLGWWRGRDTGQFASFICPAAALGAKEELGKMPHILVGIIQFLLS